MAVETTNINIRMEKSLKEQAERLFSELGMNITTAFTIFVRQSVRQGKIPFEISIVSTDGFGLQARRAFKKAFEDAGAQSVINGTDKMTMDEIDSAIAEVRRGQ